MLASGIALTVPVRPAPMANLTTSPTDRALARVELRKTANRQTQDRWKWRNERDRWARSIARGACEQGWVPSRSVRYGFLLVDRLASIESSANRSRLAPIRSPGRPPNARRPVTPTATDPDGL